MNIIEKLDLFLIESKSIDIKHLKNKFKKYFNPKTTDHRPIPDTDLIMKTGIWILESKVKYDQKNGKTSECVKNSYDYAKNNNMLVVIGFVYYPIADDNYWVEHDWVYDPKSKTHIEVTPGIKYANGRVGRISKKEQLNIPFSKYFTLKNHKFYKGTNIH